MTLEELIGADAETLKGMTDEQLLEFFKPFQNVTRPEFAQKPKTMTTSGGALVSPEEINNIKLKCAKLRAMGVDISEADMLRKLKAKK